MSAVNWLNNEELFLVYSPPDPMEETLHYIVATNKTYSNFTFRKSQFELVYASMDGPERTPPPRFSFQRLRKWEPILEDVLIITAAHSSDVGLVIKSTEPIDPLVPTANEYQVATGISDNRKATVPRCQDGDATLIGEALDLSSKEKVSQPSRRLEEVTESPTPLPAYYLLTHEGNLAAWWVVWDRSLEAGTAYSGLASVTPTATAPVTSTPQTMPPKPSIFGQNTPLPGSLFSNGRPTPTFGSPSASTANVGFGRPAFGSPSAPAGGFGFGKPNIPGTTPASAPNGGAAFGTSGPGLKPSFGATSQIGAKPNLFGSPSQMSSKPNPFGAGGSATQPNPFSLGGSSSNIAPNPFAAAAEKSKLGGGTSGSSPFSSFASNKDGKSGFGNLGQKPGLSSFGSTVTVDSKASGIGSTVPSLGNTPAQKSDSVFGTGGTSSFPSFTSTQSGSTDIGDRGRDEATPTPQNPPKLKEITGISDGKFKLGTTFKPDGSAKDDLPKPDTSSFDGLFGNKFGSALTGVGGGSKPPATPIKSSENKSTFLPSTTPATAPRPLNGLFSGNRLESTTPKPAPPKEKEPVPEDAPLPPDWRPTKPSKTDDEIPPLAGSPPVKIEAPSSSADELPSSPLDDEDDEDLSEPDEEEEEEEEDEEEDEGDDYSQEEEHTGDDESVEPSPTESGRRSRQSVTGLVNYNAAPTPPQTTQRPSHNRNSVSTPLFGGTRRDPMTSSIRPPSNPPTPQPVFSDLVDDEDERIRQELESDIEPSRTLAGFIARQEYTESARTKTGHAAQIEIVYRDINSMVDTLGLNSRSLKAFIEWNERSERFNILGREALEEVLDQGIDGEWFEKWTLSEIEELMKLEDELEKEMDQGCVKSVVKKLQEGIRMIGENAKLLSRVNDERRRIANSKDPEKLEALRKASLPKELADQQKALRKDYAQLLTQLGKAEDALLLLRSRLVSHNAKNGHTAAVPTVESIKRTITKLIDMTQKKDHQIALLESQLRKAQASAPQSSSSYSLSLRQSTSAATTTPRRGAKSRLAQPTPSTLNESPFATPPTSRSKMSLMDLNRVALTPEQPDTPSRGYGLFYTPRGSPDGQKSLASLADWVDDDLGRLRETAKRRRAMAGNLAAALRNRGVKKTVVA